MQVGSLVECIKAPIARLSIEIVPEKNIIYTVRELAVYNGKTGIRLEEISNPHLPYRQGFNECTFSVELFRELQPPMSVSEFVENCQHFVNVERNFKFDPLKPF